MTVKDSKIWPPRYLTKKKYYFASIKQLSKQDEVNKEMTQN